MSQTALTQADQAAAALLDAAVLRPEALFLQLGPCRLRLRSNSSELLRGLRRYFAPVLGAAGAADLEVTAVERAAPELGVEFTDWEREPGKTGRKDSYYELADGRLVRKVRTGLVFLQRFGVCIAAGPCVRYDNQVINFINAQYMNWLQNHGWRICHAAALAARGRGLGIAGFSGGGKSTLMLQLLEQPGVSYVTNDRLFVRREGATVQAVGIPKLPRVNPGTIVHNPRLHDLIPAPERARLLALPQAELWGIEDKYDVLVDQVYGEDRIRQQTPLDGLLILNWQRAAARPLRVEAVDLAARRDLLRGAVMKSPGPFYQYPDGRFLRDTEALPEAPYLGALHGVRVFEATGRVDFDALAQYCRDFLARD